MKIIKKYFCDYFYACNGTSYFPVSSNNPRYINVSKDAVIRQVAAFKIDLFFCSLILKKYHDLSLNF